MRLPRDLSGEGQTGSHVSLTRQAPEGSQQVTIPRHKALRVGTLNGILNTVSEQLELSKEELIRNIQK